MLCAFSSQARDDWYEPALKISGDTHVGVIHQAVTAAVVHVRMRAAGWSMTWQGPQGICRATLAVPQVMDADDVYGSPATITLEYDGMREVHRISGAGDGYNSIKIDYDGAVATLSAGGDEEVDIVTVPLAAGDITVTAPAGARCRRMQVTQTSGAVEPALHAGALSDMILRVTASTDHNEGLWEYFEKSTDPARASTGGRYIVATVADGHGGYIMVYVSGAEVESEMWRPMAVKGRMRPTLYTGDFDLDWTDASGREVTGDKYARMSGDRSQLSLEFPELGAVMRFRRVAPADAAARTGVDVTRGGR